VDANKIMNMDEKEEQWMDARKYETNPKIGERTEIVTRIKTWKRLGNLYFEIDGVEF
jgi:hypothetical protein